MLPDALPSGLTAVDQAATRNLNAKRRLLTWLLGSWILLVQLFLALGSGIGHSYSQYIRDWPVVKQHGLSPLAEHVTLRIFNPDPSALFYLYFGILVATPAVMIWGVRRARDSQSLLEWFCYGSAIYLTFIVGSVLVFLLSLLTPFFLL